MAIVPIISEGSRARHAQLRCVLGNRSEKSWQSYTRRRQDRKTNKTASAPDARQIARQSRSPRYRRKHDSRKTLIMERLRFLISILSPDNYYWKMNPAQTDDLHNFNQKAVICAASLILIAFNAK